MISIKQNSNIPMQALGLAPLRSASKLPDFRNLGICLRILVIVNLLGLLAALLLAENLGEILPVLMQISVVVQPILLLSLSLLYGLSPSLRQFKYPIGIVSVVSIVLGIGLLVHYTSNQLLPGVPMPDLTRLCLLSAVTNGIVLYYFHLRQRALSPAISEARLQALQARIRPHFLFNSINAVLSIVRSEPARAETALMDMADLFRVLMADNRDLVPLADELALCRQYLALEKLRLEERLSIAWQIDNMPPDALVPPLVLQPLLENAVYHGIEPLPEGGRITINIYANRDGVHLILSNPYVAQGIHHNGNKMALGNIRERLALHFDAEASLKSQVVGDHYQVHIVLPYHRKQG